MPHSAFALHKRETHYSLEISTRFRGSRGFWPAPVELHIILDVRQFEHGNRLSQRICREHEQRHTAYLDRCIPFFDGTGHTTHSAVRTSPLHRRRRPNKGPVPHTARLKTASLPSLSGLSASILAECPFILSIGYIGRYSPILLGLRKVLCDLPSQQVFTRRPRTPSAVAADPKATMLKRASNQDLGILLRLCSHHLLEHKRQMIFFDARFCLTESSWVLVCGRSGHPRSSLGVSFKAEITCTLAIAAACIVKS